MNYNRYQPYQQPRSNYSSYNQQGSQLHVQRVPSQPQIQPHLNIQVVPQQLNPKFPINKMPQLIQMKNTTPITSTHKVKQSSTHKVKQVQQLSTPPPPPSLFRTTIEIKNKVAPHDQNSQLARSISEQNGMKMKIRQQEETIQSQRKVIGQLELKITILIDENKFLADKPSSSVDQQAQNEIISLNQQLEQMKEDVNVWITKYQQLEERFQQNTKENENMKYDLNQRREISKMSPKQDKSTLQDQLLKSNQFKEQNVTLHRQLLDLERLNQDLNNQIRILDNDLQKIENSGGLTKVVEQEKLISSLQQQNTSQALELQSMTEQFKAIQNLNNQRQEELSNVRLQNNKLLQMTQGNQQHINQEVVSRETQIGFLTNQKTSMKQEITQLRQQVDDQESKLQEKDQQQIPNLVMIIEKLEEQKFGQSKMLDQREQQIETLAEEIDKLNDALSDLDQVKDQNELLRNDLQTITETLNSKNIELDAIMNDVEGFKNSIEQLVKEAALKELDIQDLSTKNQNLGDYNNDLVKAVQELEQERDNIQNTVTIQLQDLDKLQNLINKADQEILRLEKQIKDDENNYNQVTAQLLRAQNEKQKLLEDYEAIQQSQAAQIKKLQIKENLVNQLSNQIKLIHAEMQKSTMFLEDQLRFKSDQLNKKDSAMHRLTLDLNKIHEEMKASTLMLNNQLSDKDRQLQESNRLVMTLSQQIQGVKDEMKSSTEFLNNQLQERDNNLQKSDRMVHTLSSQIKNIQNEMQQGNEMLTRQMRSSQKQYEHQLQDKMRSSQERYEQKLQGQQQQMKDKMRSSQELYEQKLQGQQQQIKDLSDEKDEYLKNMRDSQFQLQEFKNNVKDLSNTLQSIRHQAQAFKAQNKQLNNEVIHKQNEITDLQNKLQKERQQYDKEFDELDKQLKQEIEANRNLENILKELQDNNEQLNQKILEWQQRCQMIEAQKNHDLMLVRNSFAQFRQSQLSSSDLEKKFGAERLVYQTQIEQMKNKIVQLENIEQQANDEHIQHRNEQQSLLNEFERSKQQSNEESQNHYQEMNQLRERLDQLRKSTMDVKEMSLKYGSEKANLENRINQLQILVQNQNIELTDVYELLQQRKMQQENEYGLLRKENTQLGLRIKEIEQEKIYTEEKNQLLYADLQNLQRQRSNQKSEDQQMDFSKKNLELVQKIEELEELKKKYEGALNNCAQLEQNLFDKLQIQPQSQHSQSHQKFQTYSQQHDPINNSRSTQFLNQLNQLGHE